MGNWFPAILVVVTATIVYLFLMATGHSHQAPTGWAYPYACCSNKDCRVVNRDEDAVKITAGPDGYIISTTGEVVEYGNRRIKMSPDGHYHWCSRYGKDDTRTICLFVPPPSS